MKPRRVALPPVAQALAGLQVTDGLISSAAVDGDTLSWAWTEFGQQVYAAAPDLGPLLKKTYGAGMSVDDVLDMIKQVFIGEGQEAKSTGLGTIKRSRVYFDSGKKKGLAPQYQAYYIQFKQLLLASGTGPTAENGDQTEAEAMLQTLRPAEGRFEAHPEQEGADLDEEQKTSQPTGAKTSTDIAIELNAGVSPASLQEFLVDLAKQHLAAPAAAGPVDSVRSRRGRQRELHSSSPPPQPRAPQPSNTSVKRKALSSSSSGRGAQLGAMASMEQGATLTSRKRLKLGVQRRRVTTDGEGAGKEDVPNPTPAAPVAAPRAAPPASAAISPAGDSPRKPHSAEAPSRQHQPQERQAVRTPGRLQPSSPSNATGGRVLWDDPAAADWEGPNGGEEGSGDECLPSAAAAGGGGAGSAETRQEVDYDRGEASGLGSGRQQRGRSSNPQAGYLGAAAPRAGSMPPAGYQPYRNQDGQPHGVGGQHGRSRSEGPDQGRQQQGGPMGQPYPGGAGMGPALGTAGYGGGGTGEEGEKPAPPYKYATQSLPDAARGSHVPHIAPSQEPEPLALPPTAADWAPGRQDTDSGRGAWSDAGGGSGGQAGPPGGNWPPCWAVPPPPPPQPMQTGGQAGSQGGMQERGRPSGRWTGQQGQGPAAPRAGSMPPAGQGPHDVYDGQARGAGGQHGRSRSEGPDQGRQQQGGPMGQPYPGGAGMGPTLGTARYGGGGVRYEHVDAAAEAPLHDLDTSDAARGSNALHIAPSQEPEPLALPPTAPGWAPGRQDTGSGRGAWSDAGGGSGGQAGSQGGMQERGRPSGRWTGHQGPAGPRAGSMPPAGQGPYTVYDGQARGAGGQHGRSRSEGPDQGRQQQGGPMGQPYPGGAGMGTALGTAGYDGVDGSYGDGDPAGEAPQYKYAPHPAHSLPGAQRGSYPTYLTPSQQQELFQAAAAAYWAIHQQEWGGGDVMWSGAGGGTDDGDTQVAQQARQVAALFAINGGNHTANQCGRPPSKPQQRVGSSWHQGPTAAGYAPELHSAGGGTDRWEEKPGARVIDSQQQHHHQWAPRPGNEYEKLDTLHHNPAALSHANGHPALHPQRTAGPAAWGPEAGGFVPPQAGDAVEDGATGAPMQPRAGRRLFAGPPSGQQRDNVAGGLGPLAGLQQLRVSPRQTPAGDQHAGGGSDLPASRPSGPVSGINLQGAGAFDHHQHPSRAALAQPYNHPASLHPAAGLPGMPYGQRTHAGNGSQGQVRLDQQQQPASNLAAGVGQLLRPGGQHHAERGQQYGPGQYSQGSQQGSGGVQGRHGNPSQGAPYMQATGSSCGPGDAPPSSSNSIGEGAGPGNWRGPAPAMQGALGRPGYAPGSRGHVTDGDPDVDPDYMGAGDGHGGYMQHGQGTPAPAAYHRHPSSSDPGREEAVVHAQQQWFAAQKPPRGPSHAASSGYPSMGLPPKGPRSMGGTAGGSGGPGWGPGSKESAPERHCEGRGDQGFAVRGSQSDAFHRCQQQQQQQQGPKGPHGFEGPPAQGGGSAAQGAPSGRFGGLPGLGGGSAAQGAPSGRFGGLPGLGGGSAAQGASSGTFGGLPGLGGGSAAQSAPSGNSGGLPGQGSSPTHDVGGLSQGAGSRRDGEAIARRHFNWDEGAPAVWFYVCNHDDTDARPTEQAYQVRLLDFITMGGEGLLFKGVVLQHKLPARDATARVGDVIAVKVALAFEDLHDDNQAQYNNNFQHPEAEYVMEAERSFALGHRLMQECREYTPHMLRSHAYCKVTTAGGFVDAPCVLMEYAAGGSLGNLLRKLKAARFLGLNAAATRRVICNIANALRALHTHAHAIHRDVKADNVLLREPLPADLANLSDEQLLQLVGSAVLADFGLARKLSAGELAETTAFTRGREVPEMLVEGGAFHDWRVDAWNLGLLVAECAFGDAPFPEYMQLTSEQRGEIIGYDALQQLIEGRPAFAWLRQWPCDGFLKCTLARDVSQRHSIITLFLDAQGQSYLLLGG